MKRHWLLILLLAFTLSGDTLFTISLQWTLVEAKVSRLQLGIYLCCVTLLPYLLQRFIRRLDRILATNAARFFSVLRTCGVIISILGALFLHKLPFFSLYILSGLFISIVYFSNQILEILVSSQVLKQRLSANLASRILQTAIQMGVLLGAAVAGFALDHGGIRLVCLINAVLFTVGSFGVKWLTFDSEDSDQPMTQVALSTSKELSKELPFLFRIKGSALIALILITGQLSSINYNVPFIVQTERGWSSTVFGSLEVAFGIGALVASLYAQKTWIRRFWQVSIVVIACMDILMSQVPNLIVVIGAALLLGFSFNLFRMKQREILYDAMSSTEDSLLWSRRVTIAIMLTKSIVPLVFGLLPMFSSSTLLSSVGILMLLLLSGTVGMQSSHYK